MVFNAVGFAAKLASNLKTFSDSAQTPHLRDVSAVWTALTSFYKTQGLLRTKSTAFGLPMLLVEDRERSALTSNGPIKAPDVSREVLNHYGRMADAAYHTVEGMEEFGDVVYKREEAALNLPVFYVVDTAPHSPGESAVLVICGTQGIADALTDLNAKGVPWQGTSPYGHVHSGLMAAAQNILREARPTLDRYQKLTVAGHSLGGGAGTYITLLLQEQGKKVRCFAFGSPPTLEKKDALAVKNIYSMIHGCDMVPRSSYESVLTLQDRAVAKSGQSKEVKEACKRDIGDEKELHSAGTVILKVGDTLEVLDKDDPRRNPDIIMSTSMISDHRSAQYIVNP